MRPLKKNNRKIPVFDPNPSGEFAYRILKEAQAKGILIGRIAVWAWLPDSGEHAYTKDLDIAVSRKDLHRIRSAASDKRAKIAELPIGGINISIPDKINVDFIERSDKSGDLSPLFEQAIDESIKAGNAVEIGGKKLPLVSVEFLVAMKIATMEKKDEEDAERLLKFAEVDIKKLRDIVFDHLRPLGPARLENILRETGHPESRSKGKYYKRKK